MVLTPKIIADIASENGGISYNPTTGNLNPKTGYMVSLKGYEWITPKLTEKEVAYYIATRFRALSKSNRYLGLWYNGAEWVFDVSIHIASRESAIAFAKANDQGAVWDCRKGESIYLHQQEAAA